MQVRSCEEVSRLARECRAHPLVDSIPEPPGKQGTLRLQRAKLTKRYFRLEAGTPLLVHARSKKALLARPEEAIDLRQAWKIFVLNGSRHFVIQSQANTSALTKTMEHIEFTARTHEEAKQWVATLQARKKWFESAPFNTNICTELAGEEEFFSASEEEEEECDSTSTSRLSREYEDKVKFLAQIAGPSFPLDKSMDADPILGDVPIRGANYLVDAVKVKATRMLMRLVAVDSFATQRHRIDHVSSHPLNRMQIARERGKLPAFTWVVVVQVPGASTNYAVAMYLCPISYEIATLFSSDNAHVGLTFSPLLFLLQLTHGMQQIDASALGVPPGFPALVRKFFFDESANAYRNDRFKLIPTMREAPWIVQSATPQKPAKLGQKLTQRYFFSKHYMELNLDVGSSVIADRVTRLCVGFSTKIVVQLSLVLEGQSEDELPEEIMASMSFVHIDLNQVSTPLSPVG